jgi:F-type H+-transporting ATPase subunit delta
MSLRTSARRYARALFEVAVQEADVDQVGRELDSFAAAVEGHDELRRILVGAAVPRALRAGVTRAIAERLKLSVPTGRLMDLLADRARLELVPDVAAVYRERLLIHRNIAAARVTSAAPLSPDRLSALTARLSEAAGKQLQVTAVVDPALIGGLVAQIGSTVYDGSVQTQLKKLRQQMVDQTA